MIHQKSEKGKEVFKILESLIIPTVAVINGACGGGGLELSLACKYRVASDSEKVKIVGTGFKPVHLPS